MKTENFEKTIINPDTLILDHDFTVRALRKIKELEAFYNEDFNKIRDLSVISIKDLENRRVSRKIIAEIINALRAAGINPILTKLITLQEYNEALVIIDQYKLQSEIHFDRYKSTQDENKKYIDLVSYPKIDFNEIDCPIRLLNILRSHNIKYVKDLENVSLKQLRRCKGIGYKKIQQLKDICMRAGITPKP